jgi:hypothetical protein
MSQKNVELVRGAFGVVTIPGDPEAMIAASHPGFEMHLIRGGRRAGLPGSRGCARSRARERRRGRDRWGWIVELREGRAASLRGFLDQREALAAAGLEK